MATGRDRPIPYKIVIPEWKEYINPKYFPKGISFKDPSKYLTEEGNSILKLWRARRDRGEMYFRFKAIVGSDKLPEEPDYPEGIFQNLKSPAPVAFGGRTSRAQHSEQSSDDDSDEGQVIRNRARMTSPEEEGSEVYRPGEGSESGMGPEVGEPGTGAEVDEPGIAVCAEEPGVGTELGQFGGGAEVEEPGMGTELGESGNKVGDQRIPIRYRIWSPENNEESDGQGQDSNTQLRSMPDVGEEDEEDRIQNVRRGRRSQRERFQSMGPEDITTSGPKTLPRAPQRRDISPNSSPTLAGSSPMVKRRGLRRAAGRVLLTPDGTAQSADGSPERRQLRPRRTATADTARMETETMGTRAKGKRGGLTGKGKRS